MKRATRFLHFLLANAVAVSLLTIGLRAFGDSEGAPIAH
jgi:hypothetical protein